MQRSLSGTSLNDDHINRLLSRASQKKKLAFVTQQVACLPLCEGLRVRTSPIGREENLKLMMLPELQKIFLQGTGCTLSTFSGVGKLRLRVNSLPTSYLPRTLKCFLTNMNAHEIIKVLSEVQTILTSLHIQISAPYIKQSIYQIFKQSISHFRLAGY